MISNLIIDEIISELSTRAKLVMANADDCQLEALAIGFIEHIGPHIDDKGESVFEVFDEVVRKLKNLYSNSDCLNKLSI